LNTIALSNLPRHILTAGNGAAKPDAQSRRQRRDLDLETGLTENIQPVQGPGGG
jgi:hypothetical protein